MASELLTPDTRALAPVGHRPQMFFGAHSHERTAILQNVPADARGDMTEEAHERAARRKQVVRTHAGVASLTLQNSGF
jgi:hypothetical protein